MKINEIITTAVVVCTLVFGGSNVQAGNSETLNFNKRIFSSYTHEGSKLYRSPLISHSEFAPSPSSGKIVSNVNIFNGQPYYNVPLTKVEANDLSWDVSLFYYGGIQPSLRNNNETAPAGKYGLGWSMSLPFVSINHQGTVSTLDDFIYCNLGPYGGGQILQNEEGAFFVSGNPYVKVIPTVENNQFVSWLFVMPDGNKMFMGETSQHRRFQYGLGNIISANPVSVMRSEVYYYRFDISRFSNFKETTNINFSYGFDYVGITSDTRQYVRDAWPTKISWNNQGEEVESIVFSYGEKESDDCTLNCTGAEYYTYYGFQAKDNQRVYESKYLSKIEKYVGQERVQSFDFEYSKKQTESGSYKRFLDEVAVSVVGGDTRKWIFKYHPENLMLSSIENPDKIKSHYDYRNLPIFKGKEVTTGENADGSLKLPNEIDVMRDASGDIVPFDVNHKDKYSNEVYCTDETCYAVLKKKQDDGKQSIYVQVYHSNGNFFEKVGQFTHTNLNNPQLKYTSNNFVITDIGGNRTFFYRWDTNRFVPGLDELSGDVIIYALADGTVEDVQLNDNFILIVKKNANGGKFQILPFVKNTSSGKWKRLPTGIDCGFANTADYGSVIRASKTEGTCLEWNTRIKVVSSNNLFAVANSRVVNIFEYDGESSFRDLTNMEKYGSVIDDEGVQRKKDGLVYTMFFMYEITGLYLSGNTLIITLKEDENNQYIYALQYDGSMFQKLLLAKRGNLDASVFYISEKYVLQVDYKEGRVNYYSKAQYKKDGEERIHLSKWLDGDNMNKFRFNPQKNIAYVSCARDAYYVEERDKETGRAVVDVNLNKYNNMLMEVLPYDVLADRTSELPFDAYDLHFSSSDPIVMFKRGTQKGNPNRPCDGTETTCEVSFYSQNRYFNEISVNSELYNQNTKFFRDNPAKVLNITIDYLAPGKGNIISNVNRLVLRSILDEKSGTNIIMKSMYSGKNYDSPTDYPVVSSFWVENGLKRPLNDVIETAFEYKAADEENVMEFNANTLSAQFGIVDVISRVRYNKSFVSKDRYKFIVDWDDPNMNKRLYGFERVRIGSLIEDAHYETDEINYRNKTTYEYVFERDSKWPSGLYTNNLQYVMSIKSDADGNKWAISTSNYLVDNKSGEYRVTVNGDYSHSMVAQKIVQTQSISDEKNTYEFRNPQYILTYKQYGKDINSKILEKVEEAKRSPGKENLPLIEKSVVGAVKYVYDVEWPNAVNIEYKWNPLNTSLKPGSLDNLGFIPQKEVVSRNKYGQVEELRQRTISGMRSSCTIREGLRHLPTVEFRGAACSDVAAATGEHENITLRSDEFDLSLLDNGWEMVKASLDSNQVFDGLYSYSVFAGYGPTKNIPIKEINVYKYDYVVSAYIYAVDDKPALTVEIRQANGNVVGTKITRDPVHELFQKKRWQRYEVVLSFDELTKSGLVFKDMNSEDYLRIWVGSGPNGNELNRIYVDDIVAYPSSSTFELNSYNRLGQKISSLNSNFVRNEVVYDKNHKQRTIRDGMGRIFNDQARHLLGEN